MVQFNIQDHVDAVPTLNAAAQFPSQGHIESGHTLCSNQLLARGNRETLWHLACRYRNVPLAKQLLEHGAHYTETGTGDTPLDLVGSGDLMLEDVVEHHEALRLC